MKTGKIEVVRHEGELLFKSPDGILLDLLEAYDFYFATIHIIRNGEEFDSGNVHEIGTHGPVPIFDSMPKVIGKITEVSPNCYQDCRQLLPEYFEEGDEIHFVLSHPLDWEVDFRAAYAEKEISEKLAPMEDGLMEFVNDEQFEEESERLTELFQQELAKFIFPESPVLRRRNK